MRKIDFDKVDWLNLSEDEIDSLEDQFFAEEKAKEVRVKQSKEAKDNF